MFSETHFFKNICSFKTYAIYMINIHKINLCVIIVTKRSIELAKGVISILFNVLLIVINYKYTYFND